MLKNVRHTSGIRRVRLETNAKNIVLVIPCNVQVICACSIMLQMNSCEMELWDMFLLLNSESVQTAPYSWKALELRDRRCSPSETWKRTRRLESTPKLWRDQISEASMLQGFAGEQHSGETTGHDAQRSCACGLVCEI